MANTSKTRTSATSTAKRGRKTTGTTTGARRGPKKLTAGHKAALAEGRRQGHAIRRYLEALEANKPKRGRPMNVERIKERLAEISDQYDEAGPAVRVQLTQERINLLDKLESVEVETDIEEAEEEFIEYVKGYSDRKKISYSAWRQMGVAADVLKRAGLQPRK